MVWVGRWLTFDFDSRMALVSSLHSGDSRADDDTIEGHAAPV